MRGGRSRGVKASLFVVAAVAMVWTAGAMVVWSLGLFPASVTPVSVTETPAPAPAVVVSAGVDVAGVRTPAVALFDAVTSLDMNGWVVAGKPMWAVQSPLAAVCPAHDAPSPVNSVRVGLVRERAETATATVAVYSAGLGAVAWDDTVRAVRGCDPASGSVRVVLANETRLQVVVYPAAGGAVYASGHVDGDVVAWVTAAGSAGVAGAEPEIDAAMEPVLTRSCLNRTPDAAAAARNPWQPGFTGLTRAEVVSVPLDPALMTLVTAVPPTESLPSPAELVLPERPDDPVYPTALPTPVPSPSALTHPGAAPTAAAVTRAIPDTDGPGCGWAFTGMIVSDVDPNEAAAVAAVTRGSEEARLRAAQTTWAVAAAAFAEQAPEWVGSVDSWNAYVADVEHVGAAWADIQAERDGYRDAVRAWRVKVREVSVWRANRATAQAHYDAAVAVCAQQAVPAPTADVETVNTSGECPPVRPAILDEMEPQIPTRPTPPPDPVPTVTPTPAGAPLPLPSPLPR